VPGGGDVPHQPNASQTQQQSLLDRWRRLGFKTKASLVAIVAVAAGWGTVKDNVVDPAREVWTHRQPQSDARAVSALTPGMDADAFTTVLGAEPVATIDDEVHATNYRGDLVVMEDRLYLLDTVYVEAFVSGEEVLAFAVTTRNTDNGPGLKLLGTDITLGRTTFQDVLEQNGPLANGPTFVASSCGAHTAAYYEISGSSGATLNRAIAIGVTVAGNPEADATCGPQALNLLPPVDPSATEISGPVLRRPDATYDLAAAQIRAATAVNTVAVTSGEVEPFAGLIALHPQVVGGLDPRFR
jgi:hypothetical protein